MSIIRNNGELKCPTCKSYQISEHYQEHINAFEKGSHDKPLNWTTRKFREQNNLKSDSGQFLVVPPVDITWNRI